MKLFRAFTLGISAVLACFSASAQNNGWRPIQNNLPTSVFVFQQPDIDVAPLLNEIHRYEDARSNSAPATAEPSVAGRVTYLTDQNGRQVKCAKYGDNVFCP